jgi:hypothetical protein
MKWFWKKKTPEVLEEERPPKPEKEPEFSLGFACEDRHATYSENKSVDEILGQIRVCSVCGKPKLPAVVRKTWGDCWICGLVRPYRAPYVSKTEFVRFLDNERRSFIPETTLTRLKKISEREMYDSVPPESVDYYKAGLADGQVITCQVILDEIKKGTNVKT